jgi:GH24 family phage-related lysozyme (muramidase)
MADSFVDAVNNKATGGNAIVPEAMDLVKTFESFKPTSYYDLDNKKKRGTLTVGYGFTKNDIPELREGYSIDKATAEKMLPDLIKNKYASTVKEKVKVPLNDQQYSALSSFAYNVGPTNFASSTLLKKLNAGDYQGAANEFKKWNKASGQTLEGLTRRRAAEEALFKGDVMGLGSILEKQKFGGTQPKKKGGMAEAGDSFINAMSQADLAKAVSAPIGAGGSPDNPPAPVVSEAITPLPDSPEEAGAKAAEQIAKDVATPEETGKAAAEKIAKDVEAKKEEPAFNLEEIVKEVPMGLQKDELIIKRSPTGEDQPTKEPLIKGLSFNAPTLGSVVAGLKRGAGLGRIR